MEGRPESEAPGLLYLTYEYPVLTQTFTRNEVRELARRGIRLEVYSCREARAEERDLSGEERTIRVRNGGSPLAPPALRALAGWLLRRPLRTLSLAGAVAASSYRDEPLKCWLRGFLQLLWGARLAADLAREGARPHLHAQFVDAASTVALVAARLLDTTFSVTNHTAYNPYLLVPKLRHAAFFVSISEFDRRHLLRMARGTGRRKVRVVHQGIDAARFGGGGCGRERDGPARVLSVAALREKKGHDVLIRAVAKLREAGRDVRLVIVGEGPERPGLERRVRELGVSEAVDLAGAEPPERVRARLAAADVFALAAVVAANGDLDGVPISLMEAMAAGVPVVSTRLSGIPELIEDGREGLLASPGDPESLAAAIAAVLDDPGRARAMVARAREKVEREFDLRRSAHALAVLFAAGAA